MSNWAFFQLEFNSILSSGLQLLIQKPKKELDSSFSSTEGNYLILNDEKSFVYIGETLNLSQRIKQHSNKKTPLIES